MKQISYAIILLTFLMTKISSAEELFIEVKAKKFVYNPNTITVNKGDTVHIRLISEDVTHGFYLDGYEVNTSAHPGADGSVSFVAMKTGRFTFRCSTPCGEHHPYMVGYLTVGPNKRFHLYVVLTLIFGAVSVLISFSVIKFKKRGKEENGEG